MPHDFKITRLVEFSDTDMAGIVHFTAFFRYMEQAEHAFYRSLGMSVIMQDGDRQVSFPRVHASCDYTRPLRFEDEIEIHLIVREKKAKTFSYEFIFRKVASRGVSAASSAEEVARGRLIVVCVTKDKATGTMKSLEIPAEIAARVSQAPPDYFARTQEKA
jgi:acyl-CoA thioester hydrolase